MQEVPKPFLNQKFYSDDYVDCFINCSINKSLSLNSSSALEEAMGITKLDDFRKAYSYFELFGDSPLTVNQILQVGNQINESHPYISRGYRKLGTQMEETKTPIASPKEIKEKMEELVSCYNTSWKDILDPFEKEAMFFLEFIRIHPFEDGNRRTAFLFVNMHLLKEGYAPIYMTDDIKDEYLSCIHQKDVDKMTKLFKIQSFKESEQIKKNINLNNYKK